MSISRRCVLIASALPILIASSAAGQVQEVIDRAAVYAFAAGGFDPSATDLRHTALGAEFDFQIISRLRPHIEFTHWHHGIDTPQCGLKQECDPTVSEFGGGLDVGLLGKSKLELFAGPGIGYIRNGTDSRWTWNARASATALPHGTLSPRFEIAYWRDDETGRQALLARIGVQINLTGGGNIGVTAN